MSQTALPPDNTHISTPGGFEVSASAGSTAPGAQGLAANLAIPHAIIVVIGTAAAVVVGLGILFRRCPAKAD